jgi:NADH-quinone oxidoreductase subunit J
MTAMQLVFLITAAVTIFAGVMMVSVRKLLHAALWLIMVLFGVAVIFGLLESSFLVIIQIVVYISAIAILIVFAIILTTNAVDETYQSSRRWILTAVVAVIVLAGILLALFTWPQGQALTSALPGGQQDIAAIGMAFLDPEGYLIPFEISSILLLAALVGGIYVGIDHKGEEK